jgi:hypothetical protein
MKESRQKAEADELTAKFGIAEDKAVKYLSKMSLNEAIETLADMAESSKIKLNYTPRSKEKNEESTGSGFNETRTSRLFGMFSKNLNE